MVRGNSSEKKEEALLLLFYTEHTHKHNSCRSRISLTKRAPGSTTTVRRSEMLILSELTFSLPLLEQNLNVIIVAKPVLFHLGT